MVLLLAAACWQRVARQFALPTLHPSQILPDSFWARGDVRGKLAVVASHAAARRGSPGPGVYPYSVIPGGVRDARELREIAARDYVVRRHFARFDYSRARLARAREARLVYLSYRLGENVFWTRKRVHLRAGELLLTDGAITARARCGNQVSETPKAEVSPEEPSEEVFDQPVAELEPTSALPFRSALTKPSLPGAEPLPPSAPRLFAGGVWFPSVPFGGGGVGGVCETPQQEQWEQSHGIIDNEKNEKICESKHKPPAVPEPATLVLISSGLAGIYWRYRRTAHR